MAFVHVAIFSNKYAEYRVRLLKNGGRHLEGFRTIPDFNFNVEVFEITSACFTGHDVLLEEIAECAVQHVEANRLFEEN
ncbi:hypothetical protein SUGI_0730130 [Cryptomeria japonica]|nr:hypothetical protein SUGI_0730130 [Cryptomeria japonica]